MPRVIWKHEIPTRGITEIELVQYAKIVKVEIHQHTFLFWEEHLTGLLEKYSDKVAEPVMEPWQFRVFGTGNEVSDNAGEYIGTAIDGPFVWHLYGKRTK